MLAPDPRDTALQARPTGWGLPDVLIGLIAAHAAALVGGAAILGALGLTEQADLDDARISILFLIQVPLWLGYLAFTWWPSRAKGHGIREDFGLRTTVSDAAIGLVVGVVTQVVVVPLVLWPILALWPDQDPSEAARELTDRAAGAADAVVLVLLVVVCAPIVEELFYRGLVLRSMENAWGTGVAVVASSVLFGAVHLQLVQLPALVAFGLVAAVLTVRTRRLGPAIWAHVGFNATTVAYLLLLD